MPPRVSRATLRRYPIAALTRTCCGSPSPAIPDVRAQKGPSPRGFTGQVGRRSRANTDPREASRMDQLPSRAGVRCRRRSERLTVLGEVIGHCLVGGHTAVAAPEIECHHGGGLDRPARDRPGLTCTVDGLALARRLRRAPIRPGNGFHLRGRRGGSLTEAGGSDFTEAADPGVWTQCGTPCCTSERGSRAAGGRRQRRRRRSAGRRGRGRRWWERRRRGGGGRRSGATSRSLGRTGDDQRRPGGALPMQDHDLGGTGRGASGTFPADGPRVGAGGRRQTKEASFVAPQSRNGHPCPACTGPLQDHAARRAISATAQPDRPGSARV